MTTIHLHPLDADEGRRRSEQRAVGFGLPVTKSAVLLGDYSLQGEKVNATHYRLTTLRLAQPRALADQGLAEAAYVREVNASKLDPIAVAMSLQR